MANLNLKKDVILVCGDLETTIGEVTIPGALRTGPAEGDAIPFAVEADMPAFRASLAALLREAADTIESGDFNEAPDG